MSEITSNRRVFLPHALFSFSFHWLTVTFSVFLLLLICQNYILAPRNGNFYLTYSHFIFLSEKQKYDTCKVLFDMNTRWQYCYILALRPTRKPYFLILSLICRESYFYHIGLMNKITWRCLIIYMCTHAHAVRTFMKM